MAMQRLTPTDFGLLENSGVKSVQIVWGKNAPEAKVTITRVTGQPGSGQIRHSHQGRPATPSNVAFGLEPQTGRMSELGQRPTFSAL